jgi:metal-responsive CopG/Arc/MetJ family transcriptional regulator
MASRIINMTIPDELVRRMDEVAKAEGRTRSELVREATRRYIEERQPVPKKDAARLLARLRAIATRGPKLSAEDIDSYLYGNNSGR